MASSGDPKRKEKYKQISNGQVSNVCLREGVREEEDNCLLFDFLERLYFTIIILGMNARGARQQQGTKKRQILNLRRKHQKIELISGPNEDDSPLFNTLPHSREGDASRRLELESNALNKGEEDDFLLVKTNKIYHNKVVPRQYQTFRGGNNMSKAPRGSHNNLCKGEMEVIVDKLQERPLSSQGNKFKMSEEIFRSSNDAPNNQNRPGSSKSSRLFKRKGPFGNDTINSENEEGEPLIRVTGLGSGRAGTSYGKNKGTPVIKGRVGTSLSSRQRGVEKAPGKIDHDFYRLFAQ